MIQSKSEHWENVYQTKSTTQMSWFRSHLDVSLELLALAGLNASSRVVDIGAGASTLVDDLLDRGVKDITAFDISAASLDISKHRLGSRAKDVHWLVGDAATFSFTSGRFDIWHDRAALHFLVDPQDARDYADTAAAAIVPGGHVVIGCFASDGPEKCSGLPVVRREPEDIQQLFGDQFILVASRHERHVTPANVPQSFAYALLEKSGARIGPRLASF